MSGSVFLGGSLDFTVVVCFFHFFRRKEVCRDRDYLMSGGIVGDEFEGAFAERTLWR